jgi:hypothetical protein
MSNSNKTTSTDDLPTSSVAPDGELKQSRLNSDHQNALSGHQQVFLSFFFGLLNQFDDRYNVTSNNNSTTDAPIPVSVSSSIEKLSALKIDHAESDSTLEALSTNHDHIDGVLDRIEQLIPRDPVKLRQSSLYKGTLQLIQWQRDNYLVGTEYADWRKSDRLRLQQQRRYYTFQDRSVENYNIPFNKETLSHSQLSSIASAFIPTAAVRNLLTPIVNGLFQMETGVLYDPIKQCTVNLIVDQQKQLQQTMKHHLIQILDNPHNRDTIKDSTQGIIIRTVEIDNVGTTKETE